MKTNNPNTYQTMTPDLPPVLPGFSEPVMGPLKVQPEPGFSSDDIAIYSGPEIGWERGSIGDAILPYSLRLGSAIARANGIGGESSGNTGEVTKTETPRELAGKDHIIQKLKRDNDHLTYRRNQLIGEKSELVLAIQKLLLAAPSSLPCREFHHGEKDAHSSVEDCPREIKYSEARENARNLVQKFTYKSKS